MTLYYPQSSMIMRVLWEDFGDKTNAALKQLNQLPIVARNLTVDINDYTHADTFSCEIDYKQFPFDPRCIRACGVSIFIQDQKKIFANDNGLDRIIPSASNALFQGFADEETVDFDDEKRTVRMEGRDFTALLIDQKYIGGPVALTTPLDALLQALLSSLTATVAIKIDNRTGEALPTIAQFAPNFQIGSQTKNAKPSESVWDVIQDLVARAGLIAYIEIDKLVITKPRVLYNKKQAKQFIYGRNLKSLKFKRKLGRLKGFNIRTVSFDFASKTPQEAKIPLDATSSWAVDIGINQQEVVTPTTKADGTIDPSGGQPAPYLTFRFPNMVKKQLVEVGQKLFEEISRQQIEGSFSTMDMDTIDGDSNCFDLTKLRNGVPIEITIDQGDMEGLSRLTTTSARRQFLIARQYDPNVAAALAQTLGKFSLLFYTKAAKFMVNQDSGFKLDVEFINFIEVSEKGMA